MLLIASRTAFGAAILSIMPVSVWISGWTWQPSQQTELLKTLYWINEIITQPWSIITHGLLCIWFLRCLNFHLRSSMILFLIFGTVISVGQGIKSLVKNSVQEPRPFVIWLEKTHHIPVNTFYNLKCKDRNHLVKIQTAYEQSVPSFLRKHWQKETGFSFPSGHTMFATSWTLLGVGLLWPYRHTVTIIILLIWTTGVMGSRLLLGMHWPQDLIVAILISWLIVMFVTWLTQQIYGPLILPEKNK